MSSLFQPNLLTERRKKSNQMHIVRSWRHKSFRVLICENVSHKVSIKKDILPTGKKIRMCADYWGFCAICVWVFPGSWCIFMQTFRFCSCFSCHLLGCLRNQNLQSMLTLSRASLLDCLESANTPRLKLIVLISSLIQCGFFKRSRQADSVPRYHAVRIKKETPPCHDGKVTLDALEKKQWMTTWMDNESYSWMFISWMRTCLTCAKKCTEIVLFYFCENTCHLKCK